MASRNSSSNEAEDALVAVEVDITGPDGTVRRVGGLAPPQSPPRKRWTGPSGEVFDDHESFLDAWRDH